MSETPFETVSKRPKEAKFFTKADALKGYHQIAQEDESQQITTFITPFARYKYLRAPYDLNSISEHYHRRIDEGITGLVNTSHVVDDVIIADENYDDHVRHVEAFLQRCEKFGIALNRETFQFAVQ